MWWNGCLIEVFLWSHHLIQVLLSFWLGRNIKWQTQIPHWLSPHWYDKVLSMWSFNKNTRVYYNYEDDFELMEPKYAFSREGKLWTDPQWKVLPSRLCSYIAHFTHLVPWKDMRQNFLISLWWWSTGWRIYVLGPWCWVFMFVARLASSWDLNSSATEAQTSTEVYHSRTYPDIEKDWSVAKEYRG